MRLDELLPPTDLLAYATGSRDENKFRAAGHEFLKYFRELCQLKPTDRVLDLGCGCGRMALALAGYLDRTGSYEGIDIHGPSIDWATENIAANFPNFRFQCAPVANSTYNPKGKVPPHRYRLPFPNNSFDFVFLTSLFTHMLPSSMENYFREIVRVLKVGGRSLITYFLLNDRAATSIRAGKSPYQFPHRFGCCAVQSAEQPENVVGFDETAVIQLHRRYGMALHGSIQAGKWSGQAGGVSFQDMVIGRKTWLANCRLFIQRLKPLRADRPKFIDDQRFLAKAA